MPSLTVALLLLEWLHDGVYAGRSVCMYVYICSVSARANTLNIDINSKRAKRAEEM